MSPPSFVLRAEQDLEQLMEQMEAFEALDDVDMDLVDGILTLSFPDNSKLIINRQEPLKQLWLASPEGPAHFNLGELTLQWNDSKTGEGLLESLSRILSNKLNNPVDLTKGL